MTEHRQAREDTQLCCPQPPTMWSPRKHPHARPIPRPSCSGTVPLCHLLLPSSLSLGPQQNPQRTLLRTTLPREVASPASDTGSCRSKEGDGGSSQHDTNLYPAASSQLESPPPPKCHKPLNGRGQEACHLPGWCTLAKWATEAGHTLDLSTHRALAGRQAPAQGAQAWPGATRPPGPPDEGKGPSCLEPKHVRPTSPDASLQALASSPILPELRRDQG